MPLSWVRCGVALAVSLLVLLAIARPASAQGPAFCCLPNGDCESMTPYQCLVLGGIFHPGSDACAAPCDPLVRGIGMSQTAVRRLVREGVVHTLYVDDALAVYSSTAQSMNDLWALLDQGAVIAPHIAIDPRGFIHTDAEANAQAAAAAVVARVNAAKTAWDANPVHQGYGQPLPFYWTLRLDGLGASYVGQLGPDSALPDFTNHPLDVLGGKVSSRDYFGRDSAEYERIDADTFKPTGDELTFLSQFDEEYFLLSSLAEPLPMHV